ncbi:MAG: hypothetical protein P4M02_00530 [Clostridia bacterium]|nr:hypothetical protein [Clostridia bacterium]
METVDGLRVIQETFEKDGGIFKMLPAFLPRRFGEPGFRLKLHPNDYYAFGVQRGAIKERWFSSIVPAMNGELALPDEGLSYVYMEDKKQRFLFRDAVEGLSKELIGDELIERYGTWPVFAKFYDYSTPLFHHLHLDDRSAALVGKASKPESYYFPYQLNNHMGRFPCTYFGFTPDTTKEEVKERLRNFEICDNRITELSRAYRIELGTGWYTPPGVLHAPGSVLTYEPQWNSDVNCVFENVTMGQPNPTEFLNENCPPDKKDDLDFIIGLLDWEENLRSDYKSKYFRPPVECQRQDDRFVEKWIAYGNDYISAKELTVLPGRSACIRDEAAYGCVVIQGFGDFGAHKCEAATMLRIGQPSADEFFVSRAAAVNGVEITNRSSVEPLVVLKHFGPDNPNVPVR